MPKKDIEYGELIRRARKLNNLTQADLAERLGVSQALIAHWETGRQVPPEDRRKELERVLGISKTTQAHELEDVTGPSEFGRWVKHNREKLDFSVPKLAKKAGVTPKTIYDIESGIRPNPQNKTIERLEKALKAHVPQETKKEMAEEAKIEGIGEWRTFDFKSQDDYPTCPGIYILFAPYKHPVYVGEGGDISKRISNHEDKFWFSKMDINASAYVEISDRKIRKGIEALLIKCLGPVFNTHHKHKGW